MSYRLNAVPEYITEIRIGQDNEFMEDEVIQINMDESFTILPTKANISKVISKILQSLKSSTARRKYFEQYCKYQSMDEKFQRYINLPENKAIISDSFWYILAKFFKDDYQSALVIQRRMSQNYINLMLSIPDKIDNQLFFQDYFDIVSQGVYYAFCLAYPKEIYRLDDDFRVHLIKVISKVFSGIDVSKPSIYIDKWIITLPNPQQIRKSVDKSLPPVRFSKSNKRQEVSLRYSPIVQLYLRTYKYKTKNSIPEYRMKYSKLSAQNKKYKQRRMQQFREQSNRILKQSQKQHKQDEQRQKKFQSDIRAIQKETYHYNRKIDKKKLQQISRGAHQYANQLVLLLNSKLNQNTNLGVIRKGDLPGSHT